MEIWTAVALVLCIALCVPFFRKSSQGYSRLRIWDRPLTPDVRFHRGRAGFRSSGCCRLSGAIQRPFSRARLSRFGDVVYLKIGSRRGFLITNPADVRHVLQDNARNYHKSPLYSKLRMTLGNGLLTSEDEFWLRQRRIAQPAFHRQRVAALASVMAEAAQDTAARWQSIAARGEPSDVGEEMMRLTRTVVLRALLGADLGPFTSTIDHAWTIINQHIGESFWSLGFTDWLPTSKHREFQAARAVLRGAVDHVISQRRNNPSADGDLLSMLLSARDEETGEAMTDEQLRVEVTTFLLAGQETTSLALTWTWYLLSQHAASQRRLEQEIDSCARRTSARVRRSGQSAVYAHGDRRIDASLSAGVGLLATGALRRRARRVPSAARMARVRHPLCPASASRILAGSRRVRSRALPAGTQCGPSEIRLPAVRRGATTVHR